jgi:hypothetical protein
LGVGPLGDAVVEPAQARRVDDGPGEQRDDRGTAGGDEEPEAPMPRSPHGDEMHHEEDRGDGGCERDERHEIRPGAVTQADTAYPL